MKIVHKPWGKEEWLELNDYYCYKRIYINTGYRTSLQYHDEKVETNYVISGRCELELDGKISVLEPGDFFTVYPGIRHRLRAISPLILMEVSTPQVDDVIRLEDDTGRLDGRIETEHDDYNMPFVILAAGRGERIEEATGGLNKALLPVKDKPVISHLIEKIPKNCRIILAVNNDEPLTEFFQSLYSDRGYVVDVGETNGPGDTIRKLKDQLQCPFYVSVCDLYFEHDIPDTDINWLGIAPTEYSEKYCTYYIQSGLISSRVNKKSEGYKNAFVGIARVNNYKDFWEKLSDSSELIDGFATNMSYLAQNIDWVDTGDFNEYSKLNSLSFEKNNYGKFTYKVNNCIVKVSKNKDLKQMGQRTKVMDLTPSFLSYTDHVLKYPYIEGHTLYELDDVRHYIRFIDFMVKNYWSSAIYSSKKDDYFTITNWSTIKMFYRVKEFLDNNSDVMSANGEKLPPIDNFMKPRPAHDFIRLYEFHGDLQFDNVIFDEEKYIFIDWRPQFADRIYGGDLYYDLGKLYASTIFNYYKMKQDGVTLLGNKHIIYNHQPYQDKNLNAARLYLEKVIEYDLDISLDIVKEEAGKILLSMAPLHGFGAVFFAEGKRLLNET